MPKSHDMRYLAAVGWRLQNKRESLGWSQEYVASRAQISAQQLSRYELGLSDPPISTLKRIALALDINLTALLVQTSILTE